MHAHLVAEAPAAEKSLGAIEKQYILPGAIQLNGNKLTDPTIIPEFRAGDILRLSKKHSVKIR